MKNSPELWVKIGKGIIIVSVVGVVILYFVFANVFYSSNTAYEIVMDIAYATIPTIVLGLLIIFFAKRRMVNNITAQTSPTTGPSQSSYDLFTNLWFWWIVLTVIYTTLFAIVGPNGHDTTTLSDRFVYLLGLFVPFGPQELLFIVLILPATVLGLFIESYILNKFRMSRTQRIAYIFLALFLLTLVNDFIFFHGPMSLGLLFGD